MVPAASENSLLRHQASHPAMGTVFSIAAYGPSAQHLHDHIVLCFREIDRLDDLMSHYNPASEISSINRHASATAVPVTPELFNLLEHALQLSVDTEGAFDITVGPLMKEWGFFCGCGRLPDQPALARSLQQIGYRQIILDPAAHTVRFARTGMELDLGAIGKGYAVDRVVTLLRAAGVARALVSSGTSSIYALGAPPGEPGWTISVCDPLDRRMQACSLRLRNMSISISGSYEKSFQLDGAVYSHLLDPRTGSPVKNMLMTAVIAAANTTSDALSTALFVSGLELAQRYLQHHPNLAALCYVPQPGSGLAQPVSLKSAAFALPADSLLSF